MERERAAPILVGASSLSRASPRRALCHVPPLSLWHVSLPSLVWSPAAALVSTVTSIAPTTATGEGEGEERSCKATDGSR
jgi:hypothetical protein